MSGVQPLLSNDLRRVCSAYAAGTLVITSDKLELPESNYLPELSDFPRSRCDDYHACSLQWIRMVTWIADSPSGIGLPAYVKVDAQNVLPRHQDSDHDHVMAHKFFLWGWGPTI